MERTHKTLLTADQLMNLEELECTLGWIKGSYPHTLTDVSSFVDLLKVATDVVESFGWEIESWGKEKKAPVVVDLGSLDKQ
tara:strand:- start:715 stop:957 length:243 start_codon:yes stop_codon:yes gene_type:complete